MIKSFAPLPIISLLGAAFVALPVFASAAKAEEVAAFVRTDQLASQQVAPDCTQQVWPHFDAACLRSSQTGGRISEARLISAPPPSAANRNR
jgi:hypothetical protein